MHHNKSSYSESNPNIGKLLEINSELRIEQDDYNINVTSNDGDRLSSTEVLDHYTNHAGENLPTHLYFHVPLCDYICHFCNYVKKKISDQPDVRQKTLDIWVRYLLEESQRNLNHFKWVGKAFIESFYIGGGTAASFSADHLEKIMSHVRSHYNMAPYAEISLEGNPDNFITGLVDDAIKLGFNRFSVGIQSLQQDVLDFVGRNHTVDMSLKAIDILQNTNKPYNADYMFGLPYQTVQTVTQDIEQLTKLKVPMITIYRLRNADRASMGIGNRSKWNNPRILKLMHEQKLFPTIEETYEMRQAIVDIFLREGYFPSPCGWWSRKGVYNEGNIPHVSKNKWQNYDSMIAYGPGAYGWLTGNRADVLQTHNEQSISKYVDLIEKTDLPPLAYGRFLTGARSLAARLGFNYKANQPFVVSFYKKRFDVDLLDNTSSVGKVIQKMLDKKFLYQCDSHLGTILKPTLIGEALHEEIISVYLHEMIGGLVGEKVCHRNSATLCS